MYSTYVLYIIVRYIRGSLFVITFPDASAPAIGGGKRGRESTMEDNEFLEDSPPSRSVCYLFTIHSIEETFHELLNGLFWLVGFLFICARVLCTSPYRSHFTFTETGLHLNLAITTQ